jgi:GntR family transcriptional regulator
VRETSGIIQLSQIIQLIQISRLREEEIMRFSGKQDVYLEIAERYKEYIKLGVIKIGEKLPSVRAAAGELGVNPNTVARAYSMLEAEGYIRALPKKGAFVIWDKGASDDAPDKKNVIFALRDMGISKDTLIEWIEEVYGKND